MSLTKMGGQVALTVTPAEKGKIFLEIFQGCPFPCLPCGYRTKIRQARGGSCVTGELVGWDPAPTDRMDGGSEGRLE